MPKSKYLASLTDEKRSDLRRRLWERQGQVCFICGRAIDLDLQQDSLDIDHINPLAANGLDAENNFALTHAMCNRRKGASNLEVAQRLSKFEQMQVEARDSGERGVNLAHVLGQYGGSKTVLRVSRKGDSVKLDLPETGDNASREFPLHHDRLSNTNSFFAVLPIEYLHHDDKINPRTIGSSIRGLIEEFQRGHPQLHVALAWWRDDGSGSGKIKVFDGQHKAAAQILLGTRELPVRVFLDPEIEVLRATNTNAGSKLKQVAFDRAVMHYLGSSLYADRVSEYQKMRGLDESNFSFSEAELLALFSGARQETLKNILDAQKSAVMEDDDNRLAEFVVWSGRGTVQPLSYAAVDRSFFKKFLYKGALESHIDEELEQNPRQLERRQLVRLMSLYAEKVFVGKWDETVGGHQLERRIQTGETIAHSHLRAWRLAREEVLANVLELGEMVIRNFYAVNLQSVDDGQLLHIQAPEELWVSIEHFLGHLVNLPCWVDYELSETVFGAKQNLDFWKRVFKTGIAPNNVRVLAEGLDIMQMIQTPPNSTV